MSTTAARRKFKVDFTSSSSTVVNIDINVYIQVSKINAISSMATRGHRLLSLQMNVAAVLMLENVTTEPLKCDQHDIDTQHDLNRSKYYMKTTET